MREAPGYYRHPTIHGDRLVFVCEDDLWSVDASGGVARRLTDGRAAASAPCLSPDGAHIAFTGREDGPAEVYVMAATGGPARRLTFVGGITRTVGWRPDGGAIYFQSNFGRPFAGDLWLHEVPLGGGPVRRLPWGPAREIAHARSGPAVVLGINSGDPARWKRYRGGTAGTLWIDRTGEGEFEPLLELPGNLAAPMWIGKRLWFLSDHEGHGNLYSCTATGRSVRRQTDHEDYYVRFPATDGRRVAYHAGADLFVLDPREGAPERVAVDLASPRAGRARKFVPAARWLESAHVHPAGHSLAVTARGGAFTFPLWEGAPARLGETSASRYRLLRWMPDGKRVLYVTDEGGEESLCLESADGTGRRRKLKRNLGRATSLAVAPSGERIAVTNHRNELWLVELKTGKAKRLARSEWSPVHGTAWSPDGRWLAFGLQTRRTVSQIHLHDAQRGATHAVTRPDFLDGTPAFDPEGRFLYFLSQRVYNPVYDRQYFDLGFPLATVPCAIVLAKDVPSPFSLAHRAPRAPRPAGAPEPGKPSPKGKQSQKPRTAIDLAGIEDRIVQLPVGEAIYTQIAATGKRIFLASLPMEGSLGRSWYTEGEPPAKQKLEYWDLDLDKLEPLLSGITGFQLSGDSKTLLVRAGNRLRAFPAASKPKMLSPKPAPGRETGWIDVGRVRLEVEPGAEWRQMFREAWRLQRDHFWTENMSQVDWQDVHERYLPLVERVACRSEFSDLLWEMQGELGTSHCYELAGDYDPTPRWFQGLLGADVEWVARKKAWRIVRIPRGDSWDPRSTSPLAAPGLGVRAGDEIVAVGGKRVGAKRSPHECLAHQAGREVLLDIRSRGRTRRVTVKTMPNESQLRYRDFVETNRELVHRKTRGRVGYVHVPDMGPRGYSEFHRYFKNEVDRDGLLIDVRWNGGGHVSQLLLEKLLRKRIAYDAARWQGMESYPSDAPMGPLVALTNEYAGSDGDMFSHAFKLYGLGKLVGKRTWGGVVGIWPRHALVDGTITTQAEFATWFEDVGYGVENYGTDPDIVVHNRPQDHAAGEDRQLDVAVQEVLSAIRTMKRRVPRLPAAPKLRPPRLR